MESRNLKIKDYVTHERVPVRGDSHGNFTLSPLGFPFVNRSGYDPNDPSSTPPTTFKADMLVKPNLMPAEESVQPVLEYKDEFKFPRTDSDNDTFLVKAVLKNSDSGYSISTDSARFYSGCYVTVVSEDVMFAALDGDYTVPAEHENYIVPDTQIELPEEGVSCTVTFRPELTDVSPLFIKFTGSGENNGVYKLSWSEDDNHILHYTWMYKSSIEEACTPDQVEFSVGDNDNVYGHYRNRVSDQEVADYITNVLGPAIECGKFRGAEYPVDAHGLLVKWFLSRGKIVHSAAGKTVVLDGFGHVLNNSDLGDCSGVQTDESEQSPYNIGPMHSWLMSTAGTNDYEDYPSETLTGDNNNISLEVAKSGERHTFVVQQDLENMVDTPPRKTFIHLPTGLNLEDGTEVELNIALPVTTQPNPVDDDDESVKAAIKSYADYVSQPRVYILSGKQTTLPNNSVQDSGIETWANKFTIKPRHQIDTDSSTIAFGLFNRFECQKTFRFVGNVSKIQMSDGSFWHDDRSSVLFNSVSSSPVQKGDSILLKYTARTPIIGKVVSKGESVITVDFGRALKKPYNDTHDYEVHYNGTIYYPELVSGEVPLYEFEIDAEVGDLLDFVAFEEYTEEKTVVSKTSSDDGTIFVFSTSVVGEPEVDGIYGVVTLITVDGKAFPYNRASRRWQMYSKDATCMLDIRTVDENSGLTEHTEDSGAFDDEKTLEPKFPADPKLIDVDSIIATIYPTSTNTFPWRLNGRNRVRHLGLTTNANVDYVKGDDVKPLTRLIFEMNKKVYDGISGMFRGYKPMSELRYADALDDSAEGHSVISNLLRVTLPATIDADMDDENKDSMHVVSTATKAFHNLIGDFKLARVGYESSRGWNEKKDTSWGRNGDGPSSPATAADPNNRHRINDWETKILHLPNCCLGVDENLERNLAYAGWNEYTHTLNFRLFYDPSVDDFVEWGDGYGTFHVGNKNYRDSKDAAGTTQMTVEEYRFDVSDDEPFNYTAENSVFKLFITDKDERTINQYGTFVHGFLELPIIKRGLRSISWLNYESDEFACREMEPFYPNSHVMSTDGVAFPEVNRSMLTEVAQSSDEDIQRALLAFPDKVAIYNDDDAKKLSAELISLNMPNNVLDPNPAIDYMKSLLVMYSNGMPLHMYDAHRAINVDADDAFGPLIKAHEVDMYNRHGTLAAHTQHEYCDLAYNSVSTGSEDVNMTYNLLSDSELDTTWAPVSLTTPLENVSSNFIDKVFGRKVDADETVHPGMYTRVHVKAMFSSALGRWIVKDYRQYPTCYLTPLYGAKTLDYTKKSYSYGNPSKYSNRVPMSEGMAGKDFNILKYIGACEEQPLWQLPCGVGSDYRDAMYSRYVDQPVMEMNPGCIPFLMDTFPYGNDGKLNTASRFRNLYESIMTPMDANGEPKEGAVPEVNFWNIKMHIRPARSAYPGADIPSNSARTGGTIAEPTLGMFHDPITVGDGEAEPLIYNTGDNDPDSGN